MDLTLLHETVGDNKDLIKRMMEMFFSTAPELIGKIKEAVSADDSTALRLNAHSLKGSISYFTRAAPYTTSYELEQAGTQGIEKFGGDLAALVARVETETAELIEEMRKYLCDQV